jgi:hypothetical protein
MFTILEFGLFTYMLEEFAKKGWTVKRVANLPYDPEDTTRSEPLYHYLMKRGDTFTYEPSYSCPMPHTFPSEDAAQAYVKSQTNEQQLQPIPEDI